MRGSTSVATDHELFFPIDLGSDPSLGGMVATNTGGTRLLRYGDVQRNLLGLEVVLPDAEATVLTDLTGLRKDNSGIDLKQLFVGTSGTFGIVTRAQVELHRVPRQAAAAMVVPVIHAAVPELLALFEAQAGEFLGAFEGMSANAMSAALTHNTRLRNPFSSAGLPEYAVLVELVSSMPTRKLDLSELLAQILARAMEGSHSLVKDARRPTVQTTSCRRAARSQLVHDLKAGRSPTASPAFQAFRLGLVIKVDWADIRQQQLAVLQAVDSCNTEQPFTILPDHRRNHSTGGADQKLGRPGAEGIPAQSLARNRDLKPPSGVRGPRGSVGSAKRTLTRARTKLLRAFRRPQRDFDGPAMTTTVIGVHASLLDTRLAMLPESGDELPPPDLRLAGAVPRRSLSNQQIGVGGSRLIRNSQVSRSVPHDMRWAELHRHGGSAGRSASCPRSPNGARCPKWGAEIAPDRREPVGSVRAGVSE